MLARTAVAAALFFQQILTVADTPSRASTPTGQYISWREHIIDDQAIGGVPIRGADGLQLADFDRDGILDIVTVHEDSNHVRLAFGTRDPLQWQLATLAQGNEAAAAEDAAVGDLNGDGFPDILVACELAHLIYFQNPGRNVRAGKWERRILPNTRRRGSWIRVFLADLDSNGRLEAIAANKGEQLVTNIPGEPIPEALRKPLPISMLTVPPNPLTQPWPELELIRVLIPTNSPPCDIDGDGDIDILAASRGEFRMYWLENIRKHPLEFRKHPVRIEGIADNAPGPWGFMVDFADLNNDGRKDMVLSGPKSSILWLEQPPNLDGIWKRHSIGHTFPDTPIAMTLADLNGDGRLDLITGGYSQNPRDHDGAQINAESVVGRIAWFEHQGATWQRHDISRTKRGMYDAFLARDMDGDGDLDLLGTRGNSGEFDGLFWLEQVRSVQPRKAYQPARRQESAPLPLPAADRR
ncbi:MAG: VCBS repeat-containing protein [Bryobacterales bacterium]|nr:VCBS repeat-containing protein [Bryobacterales bacterium]